MRVFLTGGTGLVGSHAAEQLAGAGHEVRTLARASSDVRHLESAGCTIVRGDVADDVGTLAVAMRGCDGLIHAAALVGARASRDRYRDANVDGTATIFRAAAQAGIGRAVHVSSVAVYGPISGRITEDRWQEAPIDARAFYAWSKRVAEIEAWRYDGADMRVTTVRPALIYGERDRHVAPRLHRLTHLPILPLVDGGRHVLPLVYAGNVAAGAVAALTTPAAAGRSYNLAHDNALPLRDFISLWCRADGRRPPRMPAIPGALIERGARAVDWLSRTVPGIDLPGARRPARLLREDNPYDSGRARAELGWTDLVPAAEAIRRTVDWIRAASGEQ